MTKTKRNEILTEVINALSPLTTTERIEVLHELIDMREHWFEVLDRVVLKRNI